MKNKFKFTIGFCILLLMSLCGYSIYSNINIEKMASKQVFVSNKANPIIVAYGDSITEGINIEEEYKWTTLLGKDLGVEVINSGVAGDSTKDGLKRIKKDVLDKHPNYVLINFGMNDHYFTKNNKTVVSIEDYQKNLTKMIADIKNIGAMPIIVLPHMIIEGNLGDGNMGGDATYYYKRHPYDYYKEVGGANKQLEVYENTAKEIANKYDVHVIDMYEKSKNTDLNTILRTIENCGTDDGVHLSKEGMKFYADNISQELKTIMKE